MNIFSLWKSSLKIYPEKILGSKDLIGRQNDFFPVVSSWFQIRTVTKNNRLRNKTMISKTIPVEFLQTTEKFEKGTLTHLRSGYVRNFLIPRKIVRYLNFEESKKYWKEKMPSLKGGKNISTESFLTKLASYKKALKTPVIIERDEQDASVLLAKSIPERLLKSTGIVAHPSVIYLPDEPITKMGEYFCFLDVSPEVPLIEFKIILQPPKIALEEDFHEKASRLYQEKQEKESSLKDAQEGKNDWVEE
eukprot:Sdes_comp9278_c0_seq1m762